MVVDPDASLEVALLAFNFLGRNVEDIAMKLIFLLLAHVQNVVLLNVLVGQHKGQPMPYVLKITLITWRGRLRRE